MECEHGIGSFQRRSERVPLSGTMSLTLQISRLFGIGPVSLKKPRIGTSQMTASVSRFDAVYGYIFVTILNGMEVIQSYLYFKHSDDIITFIITMIVMAGLVLITSTGIYDGIGRMSRMLHNLNNLNKITSRQTAVIYKELENNEKKQGWKVIVALVSCLILSITAFTLQVQVGDRYTILIAAYGIQHYILILLTIQIFLMIFAVGKALEALLLQLQKLPSLLKNESSSITPHVINSRNSDNATMKILQEICQSYETICEVVKDMNEAEGRLLFNIFISFSIYIFVALNNLIDNIVTGDIGSWIRITAEGSWCAYAICLLISFIELCHRAEQKALKVRVLLCDLLPEVIVTPDAPRNFRTVIFFDSFLLNRLVFAPLGIIQLNRSLMTTVFSIVASYLMIIFQYKMGMPQP